MGTYITAADADEGDANDDFSILNGRVLALSDPGVGRTGKKDRGVLLLRGHLDCEIYASSL